LKEYRLQKRGGVGIKAIKITPKTGNLTLSAVLGDDEEGLIVISKKGLTIHIEIRNISILSRAAQGVRVMKLDAADKIASATCI